MLYLVIFILFAILLAILLSMKASIVIDYTLNGSKDHIVVTLYAFKGLVKYKYNVSEKNREKKKDSEIFDKIDHFKQVYKLFSQVKLYLSERLTLKYINLDISYGTGDACYTGIAGGLLWAAAGAIVSYISSTFKTIEKKINITPDFSRKKFKLVLYCIFDMKVVHIIVVGLKIYFHRKKEKFNSKSE